MEPRRCTHPLARPGPILLFDGVCRLCTGWARFVIRFDTRRAVRLATVQSGAGQAILADIGLPTDSFETLVYIEDGTARFESDAVLRLLAALPPPWPLFGAFRTIPRPLRDDLYRAIARNRYRLFGIRETCVVPTQENRARFL